MQTIRSLGIVQPCEEQGRFRGMSFGLSHCGYDARADMRAAINSARYRPVTTPDGDGILLEPGQSALIDLRGYFNMPLDVAGYTRDKSTWARQGLMVSQAVLEPNWKGTLALRIFNVGDDDLAVVEGDPIVQVVFHRIDEVPDTTYSGKYQGQRPGDGGAKFE